MNLIHKPTSERTEEELQICYEQYILSKTVNGRYCPTPDIFLSRKDELDENYDEDYENYNENENYEESNNFNIQSVITFLPLKFC